MTPDVRLFFVVSVPDSEPEDASPFEGFAPSLCRNAWMIGLVATMPSDLPEPTFTDPDARLARRIAGEAPVWWAPLAPSAIRQIKFDATRPFLFVFVSPEDNAAAYMQWKANSGNLALIVAKSGGDITYDAFTIDVVRRHCASVIGLVGDQWPDAARRAALTLTESWPAPTQRALGYTIGGHNVLTPNEMALTTAGFENISDGPFQAAGFGIQPYVEAIVRTTNSIFEERERIGARDAYRINPPPPDLMLFAPSIYSHFKRTFPKKDDNKLRRGVHALVHALNSQKGYRFEMAPDRLEEALGRISEDGFFVPNPALMIRMAEIKLCTNAIGALAASELSAVVRFPNEINRTSGQVRQFAQHQRGTDARDRKRLKAFSNIQSALASATPPEFLDLLRRSKSGVRIVSDAPLEWLDIDGIPLGLAFDTSHLPTTPGNLLIPRLAGHVKLRLKPEAFREILILNALAADEPIHRLFSDAFAIYDPVFRGKVILRHVDVGSKKALVEAMNSFEGAFVIFNGHGSHEPNEPAYLWLRDEKIDVWSLKDEISRMPPIVLLSACDTHAADRNHATTATGFLSLGAIAVVGSYFPLLATEASIFAMRLIHRVIDYIPAAIADYDRAITWSEVVGGMLRMTLLKDYLLRFLKHGLINESTYQRIHEHGNLLINSEVRRPWDQIQEALAASGIPIEQTRAQFRLAIASSSAISYLHLGRPETIVFDTEARLTEQFEQWERRSRSAEPVVVT